MERVLRSGQHVGAGVQLELRGADPGIHRSAGQALETECEAGENTQERVRERAALDATALATAKLSFYDWLVVSCAGSAEPLAAIMRDFISYDGGNPIATVTGASQKFPARAAALAKSHLCDRYVDIARAAIAAHGGIGYTWEYGLNIWFRRSVFDRAVLGSPSVHRARAADLAGW